MMANPRSLRDIFLSLLLIKCSVGFYLPGLAPINYCPKTVAQSDTCKATISVYVNRLNSAESVFPFEYDHFDFCPSEKTTSSPTENLGQVVFGERIRPSPYEFSFGEDKPPTVVCTRFYKEEKDLKKLATLREAIRHNYQHHWIIDNMPVSSCYTTDDQKSQKKNVCYPSFPVGCYVDKDKKGKDDCHTLLPKDSIKAETAYVFNHIEITIDYHPRSPDWPVNPPKGAGCLVKAQVTRLASITFDDPRNIAQGIQVKQPLALPAPTEIRKDFSITYTSSVKFKPNLVVKSLSRCYIPDFVEWLGILNSIGIVLFLSVVVAKILLMYKLDNAEKAREEFGPKLVDGDVFRPPRKGMLLSLFLGSGVQILLMILIELIFPSFGFLSAAKSGDLKMYCLVFYLCLGFPAGLVSANLYKTFEGEKWKSSVIVASLSFPGVVFSVYFIRNLIFWSVGSSAAIPFSTLIALLALWFGLSLPLTFVGAYVGFKEREKADKELGWNLVHVDVFRPPQKGMLLSLFLGSGVQIFFMTLITLIFACLAFLFPASDEQLMRGCVVLYACLGTPAGYVSLRIYKMFGGKKWKSNVILISFLCPGVVFCACFILNLIFWGVGSSAAMPLPTLIALLALGFGVSVPLTLVGAYFGFNQRAIEHHVRTIEVPRLIPKKHILTKQLIGIVLEGFFPFASISFHFSFILRGIWSHQLYSMFGFLFLVFVILIITCSETTILLCFFHLCAEDYHWWWRSFLTSGFTAFCFFVYCIHYYITKLEMEGFLNAFFYLGYTFIMTFLVFLLTGTIGFFACFWFVTKIFIGRGEEKHESSKKNVTQDQSVTKIFLTKDQYGDQFTLLNMTLKPNSNL